MFTKQNQLIEKINMSLNSNRLYFPQDFAKQLAWVQKFFRTTRHFVRHAADCDAAAWGIVGKPHKSSPTPRLYRPHQRSDDGRGLFPFIFACVDHFIDSDACTDNVKTVLRLHALTESTAT
jgi:hypothetical protein